MCRYAVGQYKSHFACFKCRKTYKRRLLRDITGRPETESQEARCPQCGSLMANMGKDFEAPPMKDSKAWKHMENLYSVGIGFYSCGCSGPGYIPNSFERLIDYLEEKKREYLNSLSFWQEKDEKETTSDGKSNWDFLSKIPYELREKNTIRNEDAKNYWIGRIKEVEQNLMSLKLKNNK